MGRNILGCEYDGHSYKSLKKNIRGTSRPTSEQPMNLRVALNSSRQILSLSAPGMRGKRYAGYDPTAQDVACCACTLR